MSNIGIVVLAVVLIGVGLWRNARRRSFDLASKETVREALDAGALLFDVRTPEEFARGHVDGAVNIPVSQTVSRIGEFGAHDGTVVVYCRTGSRSGAACRLLEQRGFESVLNAGPMARVPR